MQCLHVWIARKLKYFQSRVASQLFHNQQGVLTSQQSGAERSRSRSLSPAPALMLKDIAKGAPFVDFNNVLELDRLIQVDEYEMYAYGGARAQPTNRMD